MSQICATGSMSVNIGLSMCDSAYTHPSTLVWVFVPCTAEDGGAPDAASASYDVPEYRAEFAAAFNALGMEWIWQPVTMPCVPAIVENVAANARGRPVVVMNLCDGVETDGYPGLSVVEALEERGLSFTGAGSHFYRVSTSKLVMKASFLAAGVPSPPYAAIDDPGRDIPGLCARLGVPLLVKPAVSCASMGLSVRSVVYDDEALAQQVQELHAGRHGLALSYGPGAIIAERFVAGPEFTALVIGSAMPGRGLTVYPPVERVFHSVLPELERFLSYDRYWGFYLEESPLAPEEPFYRYQLVDDAGLAGRLCELAERAYTACGGTGYGRVDIRMDRATGDLYVLEVNANCGLSGNRETSTGQILLLAGIPFHRLIADILAAARDRSE